MKVVLGLIVLFVLYNCIINLTFSVWVLNNDTMQPGFNSGDRLIIYSSFIPLKVTEAGIGKSAPFVRGSVVLVDMSRKKDIKLPVRILDGVVRFFTAQRISIFKKEEPLYLKRVIGLPGDEISMSSFVFRVKPAGSSYSLTEFELSDEPYHPLIPQIPAIWDESLPFSPSMDTIILGPDECFVISDDRGNTNDSRTWGAVPSSYIIGKAVLRIWPFTKFERL